MLRLLKKSALVLGSLALLITILLQIFWFNQTVDLPEWSRDSLALDSQNGQEKPWRRFELEARGMCASALEEWSATELGGWTRSFVTYVPVLQLRASSFHLILSPYLTIYQADGRQLVRAATEADARLRAVVEAADARLRSETAAEE